MTGAGYSGTPLAKKLGIAAGLRVAAIDPPEDYRALLSPWPEGAELDARPGAGTGLVHLFVRERAVLEREATRLRTVDAVWSGLKLVVRRELREGGRRR